MNILQLTDEFKESIYKLDKLRVDSLGNTIRIDTNSGVDYIINCDSDVNTEGIIILLLSNIKPVVDRVIKN